jgi:hypothetical protein
MGSEEFLRICKAKTCEYYNKNKTDKAADLTVNDVYTVW